jgi:hypothetical protein
VYDADVRGYTWTGSANQLVWAGSTNGLHVYNNGTLSLPTISDVEAAVNLNTAKVGITQSQADAIAANSAKVSYPGPPSWSQVTSKPNLQLALDAPVVGSPSGSGSLSLGSSTGYNTLLTYTPPDLSNYLNSTATTLAIPNTNVHFTGSGNVGIGTTSPSETLDVDGDARVQGTLFFDNSIHCRSYWGGNASGNPGRIYFNYAGGSGYGYRAYIWGGSWSGGPSQDDWRIYSYVRGAAATMTRKAFGGSATFTVYGNAYSNSTLLTSDDRFKHNEQPIINACATLMKLHGQIYDKSSKKYDEHHEGAIDEDDTSHKECGFIAQEVDQIPELRHAVTYNDLDDVYNLNYNDIFTYNVVATQELIKTVRAQAKLIASLQARVDALENVE